MRVLPRCILFVALASVAPAQSFVENTTSVPLGSPWNASFSENLSFGDVDLDGDYDVVWADGGDCCNDLNRIWINQGGLQGGTLGVFVDDTATRFPAVTDDSRDVDFVDLDLDGDLDLYVTNTSTISNQGARFLINQGGAQAGTLGYFTDETSTRWVNLGVNGPATSSSITAFMVINGGSMSGTFITWSGDGVFGDLDNDGDPDLVHSTYGNVFSGTMPSRLFLNDGAGNFEEFNPSDFQLPGTQISNGDPALWAEGVQQHGTTEFEGGEADIADSANAVELGDLNGSFDLDLVHGAIGEYPRIFQNRTSANGGVLPPLRDVTEAALSEKAFGGGNYEQELGDFDNDDDLDLFGLNWAGSYFDVVATNDGNGHFSNFTILPDSQWDDSEGDFFDLENDGDLDIFVANYSGQDRLYENSGAPGWAFTNVTASELPVLGHIGLGIETADVDFDGDTDVFVANDVNKPNQFVENVTGVADTTAPRVVLEQAPDRMRSQQGTRVRATVYDNASWDKIQYASVELEYSVNGGPADTVPMRFTGGQNFSGVLPGELNGTVSYFVRATDDHGNTGLSTTFQFVSGSAESYCTAGTSASGCQALIAANGTPSASAASGFTLDASGVEGQKDGLFFFAANGRQANSWGNGTSLQCVVPPVFRGGVLMGTGTSGACDGTFGQDLNTRWQVKPNSNPGAGAVVQAQLWYRDPQNTSNQTTSLSDAVEFTVAP